VPIHPSPYRHPPTSRVAAVRESCFLGFLPASALAGLAHTGSLPFLYEEETGFERCRLGHAAAHCAASFEEKGGGWPWVMHFMCMLSPHPTQQRGVSSICPIRNLTVSTKYMSVYLSKCVYVYVCESLCRSHSPTPPDQPSRDPTFPQSSSSSRLPRHLTSTPSLDTLRRIACESAGHFMVAATHQLS
jgi:hypothetical protein